MQIKSLPIGIQEFPNLIKNDHIYVDKTQNIHALLSQVGCPYFLARPRRFGKSLLLSTLEALFQGRQELFQGLWSGKEGRWGWSKGKAVTDLDRLTDALAKNDLEEFFIALQSVLADVPYDLHISLEKYYQSLFYLIHVLLGFRIQTEVKTNTGRIDAVIDLDDHTYVFEFKLEPGNSTPKKDLAQDSDGTKLLKSPTVQAQLSADLAKGHKKLAQAALQQIKDKKCHEKYLGKEKPVTLVGCVFTVNDMQGRPVRQATAWVSEEL